MEPTIEISDIHNLENFLSRFRLNVTLLFFIVISDADGLADGTIEGHHKMVHFFTENFWIISDSMNTVE
jgi:hypothetical protein